MNEIAEMVGQAKITPPAGKDKAPQDWEQLMTPGHVIWARLNSAKSLYLGKFSKLTLLSGAAVLLSAAVIWHSVTTGGIGPRLPRFLVNTFTSDPAHYVTIAGTAEKQDIAYQFLGDLSSTDGLSPAQWTALERAAAQDVPAHGTAVGTYTAVPMLAPAPVVTRPDKLVKEHAGDLAHGVILIPEVRYGAPTAAVAAWVGGRLSIAALSASRQPEVYESGKGWVQTADRVTCVTLLGAAPAGCSAPPPHIPADSSAGRWLASLAPAPAPVIKTKPLWGSDKPKTAEQPYYEAPSILDMLTSGLTGGLTPHFHLF